MTNIDKKAGLGLAMGATLLTAFAPAADAQRYRGGYYGRGYHHHNDNTGAAIVAGVAGLAIGAALASSNNRRYDYDRSYYYQHGYYPTNGYYYNYYQPRYNYYRDCEIRRVWDPYYGRRVAVRYCY